MSLLLHGRISLLRPVMIAAAVIAVCGPVQAGAAPARHAPITALPQCCQPSVDAIWSESREGLEADGITKPMLNTAMLWTELQYHLGLCRPYLSYKDVDFWQTWWKDTPLERSAYGQKILQSGEQAYERGGAERDSTGLSKEQCDRVITSWERDMKTSLEKKPVK